jgi:hypothetical protein
MEWDNGILPRRNTRVSSSGNNQRRGYEAMFKEIGS